MPSFRSSSGLGTWVGTSPVSVAVSENVYCQQSPGHYLVSFYLPAGYKQRGFLLLLSLFVTILGEIGIMLVVSRHLGMRRVGEVAVDEVHPSHYTHLALGYKFVCGGFGVRAHWS